MIRDCLRRSRAYLFDFDGTLADTEPVWFASYAAAFAHYGHVIDVTEYWKHWTCLGEGVAGEIRRHGLELTAGECEDIEVRRKAHFDGVVRTGEVSLFGDAVEALLCAAASGRPTAIASNSREEDIWTILAGAGRPALPCPVVGRRPGLRGKPAPDIFVYAAGVLGVDPAGCLAIEDTTKGAAAARAVGMTVAMVRTPYNREASFDLADVVFEGPEHLRVEFEGWSGAR